MPGSRQLAADMAMARNSVIYAYEQLATEGLIIADRRGSVVAALNIAAAGQASSLPGNAFQLSQRGRLLSLPFDDEEALHAFAPGVPSLADFPMRRWQRLLVRHWRKIDSGHLTYGHAAGEPTLRSAIAAHLRVTRGVLCDAQQVFITDGTQNSLDICARLFADAGERAWMENPGYPGAANAFALAQLQTVGITVDEDGIAPDEADWLQRPPKLIYVTPSHQYPLGSVLTLERRLQLIHKARDCGALIIEDDYDSEFRRDGPPLRAMQGLLPDAPVIYLGTFSKTLFPALRIGFMVVPTALCAGLEQALARCNPRGRQVEQLALAEFIQRGEFLAHLRQMRRLYAERRDAMLTALSVHLGDLAQVYGGSSGMHLSLRLDPSFCDSAISDAAFHRRIIARPLSAHAMAESGQPKANGFILGYAQVPAREMDEKIKLLAALVCST